MSKPLTPNHTLSKTAPKVALYAHQGCNDFVFNIPFSLLQVKPQGERLFELTVCSIDGQAVSTELGMSVPVTDDLQGFGHADVIIIAGWHKDKIPEPQLIQALRTAHERGVKLIALCYGTYVLAYADVLQGKTVTTHWLAKQDFGERFASVHLDCDRLYIDDGNILTSAGASGGVDCLLYWVRLTYGASIANDLARLFVTAPHRAGGQAQFIKMPLATRTKDNAINELLDYLRGNLSATHRLDELAIRLNLSRRTFSRHFRQATGLSLRAWLLQERLRYAQELLQETDKPIELIAEQAGFGSGANLREQFYKTFGLAPSAWRNVFRA